MTYALPFDIHLGAGMAGIVDLRAQITDTTGANVGAAIAAGFIDAGSGNYGWYYGGFADGFAGFVIFYQAASPAVTLAYASINPCRAVPGSTAYEFTYTVTNSLTTAPIQGAMIWVTTDLVGANTIWFGYSDVFGVARDVNGNKPYLSPGTYYFWVMLNGYSTDAWPDTEVQP